MAELLDLCALEDNIISDNINEYSITLYGEGGSGKSTFANALKRKLGSSASFFFEPRAKGLGGIKVVECLTWDVFLGYIKQLKKIRKDGKKVPFDNIIIDSVDSAYDKCTKYVMEENDWETLQGDYGNRFTVVGTEFKNAITALRNLGFIVTFVTHEKSKEAKDINNASYDKAIPIVAGQIQDIVNDQVDFIMYLQKITVENDNGDRVERRRLWLKNNPNMALKTPIKGLPDYIDYDEVEEGVDKFMKAFKEGVRITRSMYENGEDVNPNEENEKIIEITSPKINNIAEDTDDSDEDDDFETEVKSDGLPNSYNIEELRAKALEVRDKLREEKDDDEVRKILKESLGTVRIKTYEDAGKLNDFIKKYE